MHGGSVTSCREPLTCRHLCQPASLSLLVPRQGSSNGQRPAMHPLPCRWHAAACLPPPCWQLSSWQGRRQRRWQRGRGGRQCPRRFCGHSVLAGWTAITGPARAAGAAGPTGTAAAGGAAAAAAGPAVGSNAGVERLCLRGRKAACGGEGAVHAAVPGRCDASNAQHGRVGRSTYVRQAAQLAALLAC